MNINIGLLSLFFINISLHSMMVDSKSSLYTLVPQDKDSDFFKAIKSGDYDSFMHFIDSGASIMQLNRFGFDPLYVAISYHQYDICNVLLHKGANILFKPKHIKNSCSFEMAINNNDENIREVFRSYILELYGHELDIKYKSNELIMTILHNNTGEFDRLIPDYKEAILKYDKEDDVYYIDRKELELIKQKNQELTKYLHGKYGNLLRIALLYALHEKNYWVAHRLMKHGVHNSLSNK